MGNFRSRRVVPREWVRSPKFEYRRGKLLRDGCACAARVKIGMRNVRRVHITDIWSWYRVELRVGDHLGRSEELVSRCVECDLAEPESLASLGGSAPGVVDGILSLSCQGVTIVSPSTSVGGTPCRLSTSVRLTSLKLFRPDSYSTTPKYISRIVHPKYSNLCGAPNSQEYPPNPPPLPLHL